MNEAKKTFAFRLANSAPSASGKWVARQGVTLAGCTDPNDIGNYRESVDYFGRFVGIDRGYYC